MYSKENKRGASERGRSLGLGRKQTDNDHETDNLVNEQQQFTKLSFKQILHNLQDLVNKQHMLVNCMFCYCYRTRHKFIHHHQ